MAEVKYTDVTLPGPDVIDPISDGNAFVIRREVIAFALLMEQQLRANDHKPGWKRDHPVTLLRLARGEVEEVAEALGDGAVSMDMSRGGASIRAHRRAVAAECADAANFLMMVADVGGELPELPGSGDEDFPRPGLRMTGVDGALDEDGVAAQMVWQIQQVCTAEVRESQRQRDEALAEVAALKNTVEQLEPEANASGLVGLANLMGVEWETISRPELLARCWNEVQRPREEARRVLEGAIAQLDGHHVFGLARELGLDVVGGTALELRQRILDWRPAEEQP